MSEKYSKRKIVELLRTTSAELSPEADARMREELKLPQKASAEAKKQSKSEPIQLRVNQQGNRRILRDLVAALSGAVIMGAVVFAMWIHGQHGNVIPIDGDAVTGTPAPATETPTPTQGLKPGDVEINEVNFPDETFRRIVAAKLDLNSDKILSAQEIASVTEIRVSRGDLDENDEKITSLKGVEFFTEITLLSCARNNLTELDISKNTKLKRIECQENKLRALDVSANPWLEDIICSDNLIEKLDLCNLPELSILDCEKNRLSSLDLRANVKLFTLCCSDNPITTLDVSMLSLLGNIMVNNAKLTSLDLSNNLYLTWIECNGNGLETLIISPKNGWITDLRCQSNRLTSLDVSGFGMLQVLNCADNLLTSIDVSHNPDLTCLDVAYNPIRTLDVRRNSKLDWLSCSGCEFEELDLSKSMGLSALYIFDNPSLKKLDVSVCDKELYISLDSGVDLIGLGEKMYANRVDEAPDKSKWLAEHY